MNTLLSQIVTVLMLVAPQPTSIPKQLWGRWIVTKYLPTRSIACWGDAETKSLLGTQLEYSRVLFRWKNMITRNPSASTRVVSADQFHIENSGSGANSSQVDFQQLGLSKKKAVEVTIAHAPADVTGGTTEIPGDRVLLKASNTIIFSACNTYFEARRATTKQE